MEKHLPRCRACCRRKETSWRLQSRKLKTSMMHLKGSTWLCCCSSKKRRKNAVLRLNITPVCPHLASTRRRTTSWATSWSWSLSSRSRWRCLRQTSPLTTAILSSYTEAWWSASTTPSGSVIDRHLTQTALWGTSVIKTSLWTGCFCSDLCRTEDQVHGGVQRLL